MESKKMKVVIIGGVAAGPKTAARLRRLNPEAEITILEKGKVLSYAGCGMPYYVSGDMDSGNSQRQKNRHPMINSWIKNNLPCGPIDLQVPQATSFSI